MQVELNGIRATGTPEEVKELMTLLEPSANPMKEETREGVLKVDFSRLPVKVGRVLEAMVNSKEGFTKAELAKIARTDGQHGIGGTISSLVRNLKLLGYTGKIKAVDEASGRTIYVLDHPLFEQVVKKDPELLRGLHPVRQSIPA